MAGPRGRRLTDASPAPPLRTNGPIPAPIDAYWSRPIAELLALTASTPDGLGAAEAEAGRRRFGPNSPKTHRQTTPIRLFLRQLESPLVLILIFAAIISSFVREWVDAGIILLIVLGSAILGFVQEYSASNAVARLRQQLALRATVLRDGRAQSLPVEAIVPGDVVLLSAGSMIPADGVLIEANDCFVNQAVLTGETFPVAKAPGAVDAAAGLAGRTNCVFMGTSVRSGTARALIVRTGSATEFGAIAERLQLRAPETDFERGIRQFGYMLSYVMFVLVIVVFAGNVFAHKPPIEALLFAIALAVGIAPELLPAIISINLAKGAQQMAGRGVIVRRLNAIEDFGSIDILCTDKTGTLTEGVVRLDGALGPDGRPSPAVLRSAWLNARLQTGLANPLDEAILSSAGLGDTDAAGVHKLGEIPYDFVRKRLSVAVREGPGADAPLLLLTKGALESVLDVCDRAVAPGGPVTLDSAGREAILARFAGWSAQGFRVLGVATKTLPAGAGALAREAEQGLDFAGFLLFFDPPKADVKATIEALERLGVQLKIITGDNRRVAEHVAQVVGLAVEGVLTGAEIGLLRDEALWQRAERTTLFAEVDPNQKERIILALRKMGHVVGYMGDGINDAPALHAADAGISVDTAVDVAKDAADFVLLAQDLDVLRQGIEDGRRTFANSLKYVFTTTSANFGNMLSMAGASFFLPFLPLLATQVLLNNFLSDFPALGVAGDNVDPELVERPRRWDVGFIRRFMLSFGLVSSAFDFLTFGALLFVFHASPAAFRTGWFVESLLTELAIALVVRTRRPLFRSRPGTLLWVSSLLVAILAVALPYLPVGRLFEFVPLPLPLMATLIAITATYVVASELTKRVFYRWAD